MSDKLKYLSRYRKDVVFEKIENISDYHILGDWYDVFCEKDKSVKLAKVIDIWKRTNAVELRNTILYLSENLVDVEIIKYKNKYSILYSLKMMDGEVDYYEGNLPCHSITGEIADFWEETPVSLKNFYEKIHNGFYYFPSQAMGLLPIEKVKKMSNDEWGILGFLNEPLEIDLATSFTFFSTGMGGYVVLDYQKIKEENATIWFTNDQPDYNKNFWDIIDEWIVIGFE